MSDLPDGWTMVTLADLAAATPRAITDGPFGSNLKSSHYTASGPRVIRLQNIGDGIFKYEDAHVSEKHFRELEAHTVEAGDLVVASLGADLPRACLIPSDIPPAIVKADCIRVRLHEAINHKYVNYALQRPDLRHVVQDQIHGVGRPRLGMAGIKALPIPLAPFAEQLRIVDAIEEHLTRIDDAEASLRHSRKGTDVVRRMLLERSIRPLQPTCRLAEVASTQSGGTPKRDNLAYFGGDIPWIKSGELGDGKVSATSESITPLALQESSAKLVTRGTLLMAMYGATIGKLGVVDMESAATNQAVCAITPHDSVSTEFLWQVLLWKRPELVAQGKGGAQSNISQGLIRDLLIPYPPVDVQERVVGEIHSANAVMDSVSDAIDRALRRIPILRQTLLTQAFSGNLAEQNPDDEPAGTLLERIGAGRKSFVGSKARKKKVSV